MFDCQLALLENAIMRYTVEGEIPGPLGARHPTITPFQAFNTKDGALIIAAGNDSLFIKMCDALDLSGLASSPDYKTNALRLKHHRQLEHSIESVLKGGTTSHWLELLGKAGIPCGPINNVAQAIAHPQVAARNMLVEVPDGSGGTLKLTGNPLKMSAFADPKTRRAAPDLDADRAAILSYVGG
jgi:CoA:oxalate CoA-transferase